MGWRLGGGDFRLSDAKDQELSSPGGGGEAGIFPQRKLWGLLIHPPFHSPKSRSKIHPKTSLNLVLGNMHRRHSIWGVVSTSQKRGSRRKDSSSIGISRIKSFPNDLGLSPPLESGMWLGAGAGGWENAGRTLDLSWK